MEFERRQRFLEKCKYDYIGECTLLFTSSLKGTLLTQTWPFHAGNGVVFDYNGIDVTSAIWSQGEPGGREVPEYHHILMVRLELKTDPRLELRTEETIDKFEKKMDGDYLDFELKEFNETFYVTSIPRKFGYQFFTPKMITLFLENREYGIVINKGKLILHGEVSGSHFDGLGLLNDYDVYQDWINRSLRILSEILIMIPHYMYDFKKAEIGGKGKFRIRVTCPVCNKKFVLRKKMETVKCPRCKVTGEIKLY